MIDKRIAELRREKGISQAKFAEDINLATGTVAGYESGKITPALDKLLRIARYFGVSVDYILGLSDVKNIELSKYGHVQIDSFDESSIVERYRALPDSDKKRIVAIMEGLLKLDEDKNK